MCAGTLAGGSGKLTPTPTGLRSIKRLSVQLFHKIYMPRVSIYVCIADFIKAH